MSALCGRMRLLALALAACAPRPVGYLPVCQSVPPVEGQVLVHEIQCSEEVPPGGEGREGADVLLANSRFRAVIRSPEHALTVLGTGGGTLLDAAPWIGSDPLHEALPIVGGGWLDVDTFDVLADGVRVAGTVVDLPDRPADTPGATREITWRIAPDDPWLHLEGADGLWLHPNAGILPYEADSRWQDDDVLLAHDGALDVDLGGAVRLDGVTRLLVADTTTGWAEIDPEGPEIAGEAPGATALELLRGDEVEGRVGLDPLIGAFDLTIPSDVTAVRADAPFELPSDPAAPGTSMSLSTRTPGAIHVQAVWGDLDPREVGLRWTSLAGEAHAGVLAVDGTTLEVEPGSWTIDLDLGPAGAPSSTRVEVGAGQTVEAAMPVSWAWNPGSRVLATVGWYGDGDRTWRGSDADALADASSAGLGFAVVALPDEIGEVEPGEDVYRLAAVDGNLASSDDGWTIASWPWDAQAKFAGHGAPDLRHLDPATALSVATGPSSRRFTAVDLAWLSAAPAPWDVSFSPDFVRLDAPGPDGPDNWAPWWAWLDAGRAVTPLGPRTWVEVTDPGAYGETDVENGMILGAESAGTGPLLTLTWDGVSPGEVFSPPFLAPRTAVLTLAGRGAIDHLAVVTKGGARIGAVDVDGDGSFPILEPGIADSWVLAVGWSSDGSDWAVTGPIWVDPPGAATDDPGQAASASERERGSGGSANGIQGDAGGSTSAPGGSR